MAKLLGTSLHNLAEKHLYKQLAAEIISRIALVDFGLCFFIWPLHKL